MVTRIERGTVRVCALAGAIAPFGAREWTNRGEPTVAAAVLLAGVICLIAGYVVITEAGR